MDPRLVQRRHLVIGSRGPVRASIVALVAAVVLGVAPAQSIVLARDGLVAEAACGQGISGLAQTTTGASDASPSDAPPLGDGSTPIRSVAGLTLIPPSAAAAGIASGARSFRPTVGTKPAYLTPFEGGLVFSAREAARGRELWIAGPTTARRLRDINPGAASSSPRDFTQLGDVIFFTAGDASHGRELWRTDGTARGTRMVRDIRPGTRGSNPGALTVFGDRLYFAASDGSHGSELWRSDGTSTGTRMVKDVNPDGTGVDSNGDPGERSGWAVFEGRLYFQARRRVSELWRTDGTAAGTTRVASGLQVPNPIVVAGGRLFFLGSEDTGGCVVGMPYLYTSDGTTTGTVLITKPEFPWPSMLVSYRSRAWFGNQVERANGDISMRPRLWRSSGTESTTVQTRPTVAMDYDTPLLAVGGRLFMSIGGGLAASDDRGLNTKVLGDTASGWRSTIDVVSVGGRWYFPAGQRNTRELWRTDGTAAGTRLALDINSRGDGAVGSLVAADGVIWFVGDDGIRGPQLWRYVPSVR